METHVQTIQLPLVPSNRHIQRNAICGWFGLGVMQLLLFVHSGNSVSAFEDLDLSSEASVYDILGKVVSNGRRLTEAERTSVMIAAKNSSADDAHRTAMLMLYSRSLESEKVRSIEVAAHKEFLEHLLLGDGLSNDCWEVSIGVLVYSFEDEANGNEAEERWLKVARATTPERQLIFLGQLAKTRWSNTEQRSRRLHEWYAAADTSAEILEGIIDVVHVGMVSRMLQIRDGVVFYHSVSKCKNNTAELSTKMLGYLAESIMLDSQRKASSE